MSLFAELRNAVGDPNANDAFFRGAKFEDIDKDADLAAHLHKQYDPDGSKYGGDNARLKSNLLNNLTRQKSGMLSSVGTWVDSKTEQTAERQQANLAERLYESAPNRLFSANSTMAERGQALGSGLRGAIWGNYGEELALNIVLSPVMLAKAGIGFFRGATAVGIAGRLAGTEAAKDITTSLVAGQVAEEGAKQTLISQGWRAGFVSGAKTEAVIGGVAGAVGGVLEGEALNNRGLDGGSIGMNALAGGVGGAAVGGLFGGLTTMFDGRAVAREMAGDAPSDLLKRQGIQSLPERADAQIAEAAEQERLAAEQAASAAASQQAATVGPVTDGLTQQSALIRSRAAELASEISRMAKNEGRDANGRGFEVLMAVSGAIGRGADLGLSAESLRRQAGEIRIASAGKTLDNEALSAATELESRAKLLDIYSTRFQDDPDLVDTLLDDGNLSRFGIELATALDPRVKDLIDADQPRAPRAAGGAAPTQAPGGPTAGAPTAGPAAPPAGPAAPAAPAPAPAQPPAAPTAQAAGGPEVTPPAPQQVNAAAGEIDQLRGLMADADRVAFETAEQTLTAAGIDTPTFLARVGQEGGVASLANEIATATGRKPNEVRAELVRATGSVTKARVARDASGVKAPQSDQAGAAPAPGAGASQPTPTAETRVADGVAEEVVEEVDDAPSDPLFVAEKNGHKRALELTGAIGKEQTAAVAKWAEATASLEAEFEKLKPLKDAVSKLDDTRKAGVPDTDPSAKAFNAADKSFREGRKNLARTIDEKLDALRQSDDLLAIALNGVTGEQIIGNGQEIVTERIAAAAKEAFSWHYVSAIQPLLRSPFALSDFDAIIGSMPFISPKEATDIRAAFTKYAREALASEVARRGTVQAVIEAHGDDARRILGIEAPTPEQIAERAKLIDEATAAGRMVIEGNSLPDGFKVNLKPILDQFTDGLSDKEAKRLGAILRDFRRQLLVTGMAFDKQFVEEALVQRASSALREVTDEATRDANPELFRRLAVISANATFEGDPDVISVVRVADAHKHRGSYFAQRRDASRDAQGSMFPNPVVNRILIDEKGNPIPISYATTGELVSGRSVGPGRDAASGKRKTFGKSETAGTQGILSNTLGLGYYGAIFTQLRSGGAAKAVYDAGQSLIGAASNRVTTMMIGGEKVRLPQKEAIGIYFEGLAQRMETMRFNAIRRAVEGFEAGRLTEDGYNAELTRIGGLMRKVKPDEVVIVKRFHEAEVRRANDQAAAAAKAERLIEALKEGGTEAAAEIDKIVARLTASMKKGALDGVLPEAQKTSGKAAGKGKTSRSDRSAMKFSATDGKLYELIPERHVDLRPDGTVTILGEVVGTHKKDGEKVSVKFNDVDDPTVVTDLMGVAKAAKKSPGARKVMDSRRSELVTAEKAPAAVAPEQAAAPAATADEGTISPEMTRTAEVDEALAELGAPVAGAPDLMTPEMASKTLADLGYPDAVKDGYQLVLRNADDPSDFVVVGRRKKTLGDAVSNRLGERWIVGTRRVQLKKNGEPIFTIGKAVDTASTWVPLGRQRSEAAPGVAKAIEIATKNKDSAPTLARALRGPITLKDAEGVKLEDGRTLAELHRSFTVASSQAKMPGTLSDLDAEIAKLTADAELLSQLVPHGILRPNTSRRTSFHYLRQSLAGVAQGEVDASLDLLRRIAAAGGGTPMIDAAAEIPGVVGGGWFAVSGAKENWIAVKGGALPAHAALSHEVAHWAYSNLLSPSEQVSFMSLMRKHYKADGTLNRASLDKLIKPAKGLSAEGLGNKGQPVLANEVFAWAFTQHYLDVMRGAAPEENGLWQRIATVVKGVIASFFGRSKDFDPELRNLMERVLPIEPGNNRYTYDKMLDASTGERVSATAADDGNKRQKLATRYMDAMREVDEHLAKLDSALLSLTPANAGALAETLDEAATHLFVKLMGSKSNGTGEINSGLVGALRPYRQKTGAAKWIKGEDGKVEKGADGKGLIGIEPTGVPNYRVLFGRLGGGTAKEAINESRLSGALAKFKDGDAGALYEIAGALDDEVAREFNARISAIADEMEAAGKWAPEAADAIEKKVMAEMGLGAIPEGRSLWEAAVGGMSDSEKPSAALRAVAMQVRDLMADAMEHYEGRLRGASFYPERSRLAPAETPKAAPPVKATEPKTKRTPEPRAPKSKAVAGAATDLAASGTKSDTVGMPPAPNPAIAATVAPVTHRDKTQKLVIDGVGYELFEVLGIKSPTNKDISDLTGIPLGPDMEPGRPPEAGEAFDEFRAVLRRISEHLTSEKGEPIEAARLLAEMVGLQTYPDQAGIASGVAARMRGRAGLRNADSLPALERKALDRITEGPDFDSDFAKAVDETTDAVMLLIERRRISAKAQSELPGGSVMAGIAPTRADPATSHPSVVARQSANDLGNLEDEALFHLLEPLGMSDLMGEGRDEAMKALSRSLYFRQGGSYVPRPQSILQMIGDKLDGNPKAEALLAKLRAIEDQIARRSGGEELLPQQMAARQEVIAAIKAEVPELGDISDAATPVLISSRKVLGFDASPADLALSSRAIIDALAKLAGRRKGAKASIEKLLNEAGLGEGGFEPNANWIKSAESMFGGDVVMKAFDDVGLSGYRDADGKVVIVRSGLTDLDAAITNARAEAAAGTPTGELGGGEALLHLSFGELNEKLASVPISGWRQRAVAAGQPADVADMAGKMAPGKGVPADLNQVERVSRKFVFPIQLRDNASRMARAGLSWLAGRVRNENGDDFVASQHARMGAWLPKVLDGLDAVSDRTTGLKRWKDDLARNARGVISDKVHQSEAEERIVRALRDGTVAALSKEDRVAAMKVQRFFQEARQQMIDAGIPVADIRGKNGIDNYLPQRFNISWLAQNEAEATKRLASWLRKEGNDEATAKSKAASVIQRALAADDDAAWLGGAFSDPVHRSAFSGDTYSRVLNISSKDMRDMGLADLFDNNIRGLVVGYAQTAATRIEVAKRFGVRGHGVSTYMDIAARGAGAAIDALMSPITGTTNVRGAVDGQQVVDQSFLVAPLLRDRAGAERLVNVLVESLSSPDMLAAKQKGLVDSLVGMHPGLDEQAEKHFRSRAEAIVGALSDFGGRSDVAASRELEFARQFVGRIAGEGQTLSEAEQRFVPMQRALSTFNSVTLLSLATLSSITDAAMPLVRSGEFGAWTKGLGSLIGSFVGMGSEGQRAMRELGVQLEPVIHSAMQDVHGGRMGHLSNSFFLANGLTPWTNAMRNMAGVVGFESIKTAQRIVQQELSAGRLDSRDYLKSMRYLRQLGVAELADANMLTTPQALSSLPSDDAFRLTVSRALVRFSNESVFQPGRTDIPLQFQDNPFWKLMFQFKSFPLMFGRAVKRAALEVTAKEDGKRILNVKPLAFLLTVGAGLAAGSMALRDVASGRNEENEENPRSVRDRSASRILQELGFLGKDETLDNETADKAIGWYAESLLQMGALGLVGDMFYQSARAMDNGAFGRERIMSQIMGPSVGTMQDVVKVLAGATNTDDSNADERTAARSVVGRIPVLASQRPLAEWLTDWAAGEKGDMTLE